MKLKSKQEEIFEVEKDVACRSVTVKNMVDDTGLDTPVPLPMVDSKILIKVIEYCKYHRTRARLRDRTPARPRRGRRRGCSARQLRAGGRWRARLDLRWPRRCQRPRCPGGVPRAWRRAL